MARRNSRGKKRQVGELPEAEMQFESLAIPFLLLLLLHDLGSSEPCLAPWYDLLSGQNLVRSPGAQRLVGWTQQAGVAGGPRMSRHAASMHWEREEERTRLAVNTIEKSGLARHLPLWEPYVTGHECPLN